MLHALCFGVASLVGPTKIMKSPNFAQHMVFYLLVVGESGTYKSHVFSHVVQMMKDVLRIDCDQLEKLNYWVDGLRKMITTSCASFPMLCKKMEQSHSRACLKFDEFNNFAKTFETGCQGSDASSTLLSTYDRLNIKREFIDSNYQSDVLQPNMNLVVIGQPDIIKEGIKSIVSNGGLSRFLISMATIPF